MNHILDHKGYRFFQASFMPDEKGTILSVNHDFWGTWITYIGYFLLYTGLVGIMCFGKTRFKDLGRALEKVKKKKAKIATVILFNEDAKAHFAGISSPVFFVPVFGHQDLFLVGLIGTSIQ